MPIMSALFYGEARCIASLQFHLFTGGLGRRCASFLRFLPPFFNQNLKTNIDFGTKSNFKLFKVTFWRIGSKTA